MPVVANGAAALEIAVERGQLPHTAILTAFCYKVMVWGDPCTQGLHETDQFLCCARGVSGIVRHGPASLDRAE